MKPAAAADVTVLRCETCGGVDRVPVDQLARYVRREDGKLRCPYLACGGAMVRTGGARP